MHLFSPRASEHAKLFSARCERLKGLLECIPVRSPRSVSQQIPYDEFFSFVQELRTEVDAARAGQAAAATQASAYRISTEDEVRALRAEVAASRDEAAEAAACAWQWRSVAMSDHTNGDAHADHDRAQMFEAELAAGHDELVYLRSALAASEVSAEAVQKATANSNAKFNSRLQKYSQRFVAQTDLDRVDTELSNALNQARWEVEEAGIVSAEVVFQQNRTREVMVRLARAEEQLERDSSVKAQLFARVEQAEREVDRLRGETCLNSSSAHVPEGVRSMSDVTARLAGVEDKLERDAFARAQLLNRVGQMEREAYWLRVEVDFLSREGVAEAHSPRSANAVRSQHRSAWPEDGMPFREASEPPHGLAHGPVRDLQSSPVRKTSVSATNLPSEFNLDGVQGFKSTNWRRDLFS